MDQTTQPAAIEIEGLTVAFAGQRALDSVSLSIRRGRVSALLGMNGSGKSTLIKVLAGIYTSEPGARILFDGVESSLPLTPRSSHAHGMRFLHQDVGLVQPLTVSDNFAFVNQFAKRGLGAIARKRQHRLVQEALDRFNLPVKPGDLVADLNPTLQTMTAIARAFQADDTGTSAFERNVLVLDEPTASLPGGEVEQLLTMIEDLRSHGGTIIYVSHRSEEVRRLADDLIVLRDGKLVVSEPAGDISVDELVERIVGHRVEREVRQHVTTRSDRTALKVTGLSGPRLNEISLELKAGEIVGITGLVGCGRSELVRMIAGAQQPDAGTMELGGKAYAPAAPTDAIREGVSCVPQERRRDGVILPMSVAENLTLGNLRRITSRGYLSAKRERRVASELQQTYSVKTAGLGLPIALLSGGNQQKVVVARAASHEGRVLLLDEPTQGVDVHAKEEISGIVRKLAADGMTVVVASTDFEDFVGLCDRVLVLDRGSISSELSGAEITDDTLAAACAASGNSPEPFEADASLLGQAPGGGVARVPSSC
ncbi:MAG: sugar ABC transporter ATP-binding protein [Leucobacter sp.]